MSKLTVTRHVLWIALALSPFVLKSAIAQHEQNHAPGHEGSTDPAVAAYMVASDRMHRGMAIEFSGDPDVDFARAMIPHHQGAIDMAQAVLEYGQDPEIRALADGIITAQENEIAVLRAWLEERGETVD